MLKKLLWKKCRSEIIDERCGVTGPRDHFEYTLLPSLYSSAFDAGSTGTATPILEVAVGSYQAALHRMPTLPESDAPEERQNGGRERRPAKVQADGSETQDRYSRQILFSGVGADGQRRLGKAHVAVVGVGATGAATASLLARAGVGRMTLIDRDFVETSNLQRQILYDEADAREALPKAEAARRKIAAFNSSVDVRAEIADLVPGNIRELLAEADLVLDCTDNFETRYLLNDYAVAEGKPWIYAAAVGAYAASMTIQTIGEYRTACLACVFPAPPLGAVETCDTAGILGMAVNLAASVQSAEALKLLTGQAAIARRTLLTFDLWTNQRSEIATSNPNPGCAVCGLREFTHLAGAARPHITLCGRNSVQIHEHRRPIDLTELRARLERQPDLSDVRSNAMLLRFRRGEHTITVFPDGRALVQGTTDPAVARTLYARFIGS
jgi:molybdopterin/thiamine biosynthesis adenylyltransferase